MKARPLRLTLRQLSVFAAVAQHGTTVGAADELALSQSAVSGALADLEQALGGALFDRFGRRLVINETGRMLFPRVLSLLEQAHELERLPLTSGVQLRVAASNTIGSYILPALLAGFRNVQSGPCALDMRIGNTRETLQALLKFEADIGLVEGHCQGNELVSTHWGDDEMLVVVSPSHALARTSPGSPGAAALRDADWVVREPGSGTREIIEERLAPQFGPLRFALELGNAEAIKRAVMSGFGVSCLSWHVVGDEIARGTLVALREGLPPLVRPLHLVLHKDKYLTHGLRAFTDYLQQNRPKPLG
ncbi:LysR family transcriptional regulator [Polaromonas jejuensis]|uniref:LysR family transcriptional regulator n=1 Tax=Polaromonas jejuensis TaxID=457502 RepID=A0ABW0QGM3_9BURK|nr:LysR family transcriptional regulator [Polaromonas jejuensis]